MAALVDTPIDTDAQLVNDPTCFGDEYLVVLPIPICPLPLFPQPYSGYEILAAGLAKVFNPGLTKEAGYR
jgi:hypothetical protein